MRDILANVGVRFDRGFFRYFLGVLVGWVCVLMFVV